MVSTSSDGKGSLLPLSEGRSSEDIMSLRRKLKESLLEIMQLEENEKEVTILPQPKDYHNLKVGS